MATPYMVKLYMALPYMYGSAISYGPWDRDHDMGTKLKCINRYEKRAMNLIIGPNDSKYNSGAAEKHFLFFEKSHFFIFVDPFLDISDDAKTSPKGQRWRVRR